jgi:hypothetical protein
LIIGCRLIAPVFGIFNPAFFYRIVGYAKDNKSFEARENAVPKHIKTRNNNPNRLIL